MAPGPDSIAPVIDPRGGRSASSAVRAPRAAWLRSLGPLVVADLRQRYAGSVLGALWAVLGPLVEVAAYALVFGLVFRPQTGADGFAYALYIASGVLPWSALREALEGSASLLPANRWIRRSRVPFDLLVARQAVVASTRAFVGLALVLVVAFSAGRATGAPAVALTAAALVVQTLSAYGLGLALAPLGTLYPDLRPALGSALTVLVFASPIVYPESLLGPAARAVLEWNPFTHLLRLYRAPLVAAGPAPGTLDLVLSALTPLVLVPLGLAVKHRLRWAARDRL